MDWFPWMTLNWIELNAVIQWNPIELHWNQWNSIQNKIEFTRITLINIHHSLQDRSHWDSTPYKEFYWDSTQWHCIWRNPLQYNMEFSGFPFNDIELSWIQFKKTKNFTGISLNDIEFGGIIPFNNIEFSGFLFNNTELSWIKFRKLISWITLNSVQFHSIWNWIQCDSTS